MTPGIRRANRDFLDELEGLKAAFLVAARDLRDEDIMEFRRAMRRLQRTLSPAVYALETRARATCVAHTDKRALYLINGQAYCTPCAFATADGQARPNEPDENYRARLMAWWHDFHGTEPER